MGKLLLLLLGYLCFIQAHSQVGIGTNNPNNKAALDVQATDKGVLFPRLTTSQRNAIVNPPDGLHIYNSTERCLNFYDSAFLTWNCYCESDSCKVITIRIPTSINVDVYSTYAIKYPGRSKFVFLIEAGDTIYGQGALNFSTFPLSTTYSITIVNRGVIIGYGGMGGTGAGGQTGSCYRSGFPGTEGYAAVVTNSAAKIKIQNYGVVAGGGGGGGGGGGSTFGQYGGGGGGGAGYRQSVFGRGGAGGGNTTIGGFGACNLASSIAQSGTDGTVTSNGIGGNGVNGGTGGAGGGRGQPGQNGTGASPGLGGAAGKAISGGIGNSITNISGGQTFGAID